MVFPTRISEAIVAEWVMPERTQCLNQRFFNHAVFDIQGQLASALPRRAPAHTVGQAGNIPDFFRLYPLPLGDGRAGPDMRLLPQDIC